MFQKPLEIGKTLVTIAAACADPSFYSVATASFETAMLGFDALASEKPELKKLAKEIDKKFTHELKKPFYDIPRDSRTLLPQMLEFSVANAEVFIRNDLSAEKIIDGIISSIPKRPEYSSAHFKAFKRLYSPILHKVCKDERLLGALKVPLTKEVLRRLSTLNSQNEVQIAEQKIAKQQREEILEILKSANEGALAKALDSPEKLSLEELQAIASKFGFHDFETKDNLISFLEFKSDELRKLKLELDALRGTTVRIDNIHGAAISAINDLDLEKAKELLASAKETLHEATLKPALDLNTKLLKAEASIALLTDDVEQAYELLSQAADSYLSIGISASILMRVSLEPVLSNYGTHKGRHGLNYALRFMKDALSKVDKGSYLDEYQAVQNDIGNIHLLMADSLRGTENKRNLDLSKIALKEARRVNKLLGNPYNWAMCTNSLANTIKGCCREERKPKKRNKLLLKARGLYQEALVEFTEQRYPNENAMVKRNLCSTLGQLAEETKGQSDYNYFVAEALLMGKAANIHFQNVGDKDAYLNNCIDLALIYAHDAELNGFKDKEKSIWAFNYLDAARDVIDPETSPAYWLRIQLNRVALESKIALCVEEDRQLEKLQHAFEEIEKLINEIEGEDHSHDWAEAQKLSKLLQEAIARHSND